MADPRQSFGVMAAAVSVNLKSATGTESSKDPSLASRKWNKQDSFQAPSLSRIPAKMRGMMKSCAGHRAEQHQGDGKGTVHSGDPQATGATMDRPPSGIPRQGLGPRGAS